MELADKVVLLTGASRGIGRAYVLALMQAGAHVVGLARSSEDPPLDAEAASGAMKTPRTGSLLRLACDLTSEEAVASAVKRVIGEHGRIDVLVNNAGVFTHHEPLGTSKDAWDEMMAINLRGPYLMIRESAPHMVKAGVGSIINVSSNSALPTERDTPGHRGLMVYGVSKAAVDRLTTYMAAELEPQGVAVNGLRPGGVLTDTWRSAAPKDWEWAKESGKGQLPIPEVVGPPLVYLAQQTSATMTGQVVSSREFGDSWPA